MLLTPEHEWTQLFGHIIISIILIVLSLLIFTARYQLEINLTGQFFHDYLWIARFKKGERVRFNSIEGLFLNKNKYRQTINSRISSMTKYGTEYNGYIRFDVSDVHLISSGNKSKVIRKLTGIRKRLNSNIIQNTIIIINTPIIDYSEPEGEAKEMI